MNEQLKNKIEATDTSISVLLKDQKFYIDYFQREFRWEAKHMKTLITDLTSTFLGSYQEGHKPGEVAKYQTYYLGPVVFSVSQETAKKSIIDGQQRITSITLFLIYLNHLQKNFPDKEKVSISNMVFSTKHREKSFNMTDEYREDCLKALYETGEYKPNENDDETVINMVARYNEINDVFPEEIDDVALPFFIDWLIENVVFVEITAYSNENAYIIFEAMNDRGLNLTPSEMLKGYVLSNIDDGLKRNEINNIWKEQIQKLHEYGKNADIAFFQSWFRGKYAITIRPGKAGSENQDFEKIGSRFHNWFKDVHESLFELPTSDDVYTFFKKQFPFFVKVYLKLWDALKEYNSDLPHLAYIEHWGIAESLQDPLLLAPINFGDSDDIINKKLDFVARYIETFTVKRALNYKKFGQTSIKYTMFNIVKLIRNNSLIELGKNLSDEIQDISYSWDGVEDFRLHGQNKRFIKHLLSRITSHLDTLVGKNTNYVTYHHPKGKPFQIEHLWADKFIEHRDEFDQEGDFKKWRNSIGALILIPAGTNQSYNSDKYIDKLDHYLKENTYAQTLHPAYYTKNPNFLKSDTIKALNFQYHENFKKEDIAIRKELVQRICENLWSVDYFKIESEPPESV